jgi:TonB family protein
LARPVKPKAASSPKNSPAPKPGKSALPKPEQSAAILPKRSPRKQQATPPKKIAVAPTIREPQPKPQETTAAPTIREPKPKPQENTAAPATSQPKPQPPKIATAPTIREPKPQPQATTVAPVTPQSKPPSQVRRSPTSGVASRLGGPISISGRDRNGNYQAALPNSNRFNRGAAGIDARRDVDIGSYLQQLQQQVRQQWIPGITQSSHRTVVYFVVSRSGQVSGLRIARPSGSNAIDRAALSAIQRAAPFAPLPTGYSSNYINIQFTFNINVSGELELWSR